MKHFEISLDTGVFIEDYLAPDMHTAYSELSAAIFERSPWQLEIIELEAVE